MRDMCVNDLCRTVAIYDMIIYEHQHLDAAVYTENQSSCFCYSNLEVQHGWAKGRAKIIDQEYVNNYLMEMYLMFAANGLLFFKKIFLLAAE